MSVMLLPGIFSLIFFISSVIYLILGIYILDLNRQSALHRVFSCVCFALGIWAFSFSFANSAVKYDISLLWRRIATLGWGMFYSLLLHFTLILTEKYHAVKKGWQFCLLYLPALVTVNVFGLDSKMVLNHYNLVWTYAGWVNISTNSGWDKFFNIYYAGFSLTSISLIWGWGLRTSESRIKKQAYLMVFSYALAFFAGTLTEIVINLYFSIKVPQVAPILILIPVCTMVYCIKRYGLMPSISKDQSVGVGQILSDVNRSKLYMYITQAFIYGALINFGAQYFINHSSLEHVLAFCGFMMLAGILLQLVQRFSTNTDVKDLFSNIILTMSIPVMILNYIEYASITVWAIPTVFIVLSIAFSKRQTLLMVGAVTLATVIYVWIRVPEKTVKVENVDHIFRVVIYGFLLWIAFYINKIYIQRLKQTEDQVKAQRLLAQISADLVIASEVNMDEKINGVLQRSCEHLGADRAHVIIFSNITDMHINNIFEWCDAGIEPISDKIKRASHDKYSDWLEICRIASEKGMSILNSAEMPPDSPMGKWLKEYRTKSVLRMLLKNKENVIGLLSFYIVNKNDCFNIGHQEIIGIIGNRIADVFLKVQAEKEVNYMAYYDALTGLPNGMQFRNRLEEAISLANRTEKLIGVMFVDLDSFKIVNDTMGHDAGDTLLVHMAQRLSGCIRKYDIVARFGGDEFLFMIPQVSEMEDIYRVADKIMEAFKQPVAIMDQEFFLTGSLGISVYPLDGEKTDDLIKNADTAMYISKEKGKNRYTFCSEDIKEKTRLDMELTNSLYRAQERNELVMYYQPQVSIDSGEILGLEALIRWNHPKFGMISPGVFIPIAEKNGLINPIGQWVLKEVCRQNMEWQSKGLPPIRTAVNLSLGQFHNPKLVEVVGEILRDSGIDPECMDFEITESIAINELEYIIKTLDELKAFGVSISIDDFGTRYSSLSRLKNLPIDRIKVDMHFVQGISKNPKDEGIVKIIIQLGKTLGLKVTAEGVETEQQLDFLRAAGCDEAQGFYFSKPVTSEEVEKLLAHRIAIRNIL
ncbi:MAG: EAL domain-containing protein [Pseudomonadota bacterium]